MTAACQTSPLRSAAMGELTDRDRDILSFERQWWKHVGAKEAAIRDLFGITPTRYYQLVHGLLERPEALAYDAPLVLRLRRLRETRLHARTARRLPIG